MRIVVLGLTFTACGRAYPPDLPLDPSFTQCDTDEDCVTVELGCCDECNGGLAVSVHEDQADTVRDRFSESCSADAVCTTRSCGAWQTSCAGGTCALDRVDPEGRL